MYCKRVFCQHTDLAGMLACSRVYSGVRHILCIWHVDRYFEQLICTNQKLYTIQSLAEKIEQHCKVSAAQSRIVCMFKNAND